MRTGRHTSPDCRNWSPRWRGSPRPRHTSGLRRRSAALICRRRTPRRCRCRAARSTSTIRGICRGPTTPRRSSAASQPGQTLTIKGPRQMGKSSLLMRTVKAGLDHGKRVALLDFQLVDEATKADATLFFGRFASSIAEQLELPDTVRQQWDAGYSNPQNCTRYVERQILQPLNASVHDRDRRDRLDLPDDVFGGLLRDAAELARTARASGAARRGRTWTSFSRRRPSRSCSSNDRTSRPSTSASFLPLEDFVPEQVARLNALHPKPLGDADVQRLYALIGGHPYLTRKALYMLAGSTPDVERRRSLRARDRGHRALRRSPAVLPPALAAQT